MKNNKGLTLVEVIVVMAFFGTIALFFWSILQSSTEDSYTLNDKVAVQSSVTSLMNIIQQDIQEAQVIYINSDIDNPEKGVVIVYEKGKQYVLNTDCDQYGGYEKKDNTIEYIFDDTKRTVTRSKTNIIEGEQKVEESVYNDIAYFSMEPETGAKHGAKVSIIGGKEVEVTVSGGNKTETFDKTRYELNSTYYTRNTI